jgi:putative component of toxin-antitoxin plasmid stabilization module
MRMRVRMTEFTAIGSTLSRIEQLAHASRRVDRLVHGNPGQHRNLTGGVSELKIDFGPGY